MISSRPLISLVLAVLVGALACSTATPTSSSGDPVGDPPDAAMPESPDSDAGKNAASDACALQAAQIELDLVRADGKTVHLVSADVEEDEKDGETMLSATFAVAELDIYRMLISISYRTAKITANTEYASTEDSDVRIVLVHGKTPDSAVLGIAKGGTILFSRAKATECESVEATFDGLEYSSTDSKEPLKARLVSGTFRSHTL